MDGILAFELIGTHFCDFTDEPSWREEPPIQQNVQEGTYRQTGIYLLMQNAVISNH